MKQRTLPARSEVDPEICWNLTHLFEDEDAARAEGQALRDEFEAFFTAFPSEKIAETSVPELLPEVSRLLDLQGRLSDLSIYAMLWASEDYSNARSQRLAMDVSSLVSELMARVSGYQSALVELPEATLRELQAGAPDYGVFFADLLRERPHRLSAETERVLASLSILSNLPYETYEASKLGDLRFQPLQLERGEQPLSYVLYENDYSVSPDTELRRRSFEQFSETLGQQRQTLATIYNAQVQAEKIEATLRGYDSVIDYLLDRQKVERELYDRQIDGITQGFAPIMRRYAKLLQRELGLETMTFADLKAPLDPELDPDVSIDEAKAMVRSALEVMGPDYQERVMRFESEGWVDFAQNLGKSTGGFCTGTVKAHPYILLSWTGKMSEVFTLIHELGHAAQDLYGLEENRWIQSSPSMYIIEAPSTMHELLLARYLRGKYEDDPRMRRWVLDSMISKTYYHNFVTHLLEADFQREVYRRVDRGENLGADDFDEITRTSLENFWGDAVEINPGAERTWMRQPHYYMGLYPYTYSASLTVSTGFYQRLMGDDPEAAVQDWIRFLRTGDRKTPLELAEIVGFDLRDDQLLQETLRWLDRVVAEIEALS